MSEIAGSEWSHIWVSLHKYEQGAGISERGRTNAKKWQEWLLFGADLGVTNENDGEDVVRFGAPGGCNWYKCPLYGGDDVSALEVRMMVCSRCRKVRANIAYFYGDLAAHLRKCRYTIAR